MYTGLGLCALGWMVYTEAVFRALGLADVHRHWVMYIDNEFCILGLVLDGKL